MDTKLKKYNGAGVKVIEGSSLRPWICVLSGMAFIFAGCRFAEALCKVMRVYDLDSYCSGMLFPSQGAYAESTAYSVVTEVLSAQWKLVIFFGAMMLATFALCIWMTGKKITWFDKIFTEIQVLAFTLAAVGVAGMCCVNYETMYSTTWMEVLFDNMELTQKQINSLAENWGWGYYDIPFEPAWLETFAIHGTMAVLLGLCLLLFLSWIKKMKAGCFWRRTFIGAVIGFFVDAGRDSKDVQGKVLLLMLAGAFLSATWIGLIVVIAAIVYFVPKQLKKYMAIRDGVTAVKEGNLDYKIETLQPGEKPGELDRLAQGINEISTATSIAVANELKNQRMKTDLISNVSHDLKTPLTSMVSYVDLLRKEGLDSEHAEEYLGIIEEKTGRLQKLTEDLFEAAKASSGSIPVHMERIEMTSIVNQALAEVGGRLEDAQLDVIFDNQVEDAFVMADGQLLWRVMENLLVNAGKYALPGSRVYIDVTEQPSDLRLDIKNISKERLNIDAEELMERFKRGDESRNTEGSGLGLAIAKDLVHLMDGEFSLTIDGDLFKASVALKKA